MSIGPLELVDLSDRLMASSLEVDQRSGVSRSYYSCFHLCKVLLVDLERSEPGDRTSHVAVTDALRTHRASTDLSDKVILNRIASNLLKLKTSRHNADYFIAYDWDPKVLRVGQKLRDAIFADVRQLSSQRQLGNTLELVRTENGQAIS